MTWLHTLFIIVLAYLAVCLEGTLDLFRSFTAAQITLLPALMVYTSLTCGVGTVAMLSIWGGLLRDSLGGDPLGVSILPLFLIGFVISQKRDLLLRDHEFAQMALGMAAGALFPLGVLFLLFNMGHAPLLGWMGLWQWLVGTVAGGVLTPGLFWLFHRFRRAFEYPVANQVSFREDREIKRGRQ
jgi:cell shape-determining protein MreD